MNSIKNFGFIAHTIALVLVANLVASPAYGVNWIGGNGSWGDIAGEFGWDTAIPPDGLAAIANKSDSVAAVTTQDSGFQRTLGTISLGGSADISWTVDGLHGIALDQNGVDTGFATISNSNSAAGPTNALVITGAITLNDDLLVANSSSSTNTTGAIQLNGVLSGSGNVTFRNEVTSTDGTQEGFIRLGTAGANDFFGNVLIQKGITWISNNTSLGNPSNTVTLGDSAGGGQGSASLLVQTAGVNAFTNPISVVAGSGGALYLGTTSTGAPSIASPIQLEANSSLNLVSASTNDNGLTMAGFISGPGSIVMPATLPTNVANARLRFSGFNDFTGGTTLSGGTLLVANGTDTDDPATYTSGPIGRGTLTLNGGTLAIPVSVVGEVRVANPINVTAASTVLAVGSTGDALTLTGPINLSPNAQLNLVAGNTSVTNNLMGPITGDSTTVINATVGSTTGNGTNNIVGDLSGFTGTIRSTTGSTQAASLGASVNLTYHTVNGENIKFEINAAGGNTNIPVQQSRFFRFGFNNDPNGMPAASLLKMGSLSGNGHINAQTGGTVQYASTNYEVGHLNQDTEFSGQIFPRATSTFTKVGTGALTLSGPNSYNGTTIVSAGTLIAGADVASSTIAATPATMPAGDTVTLTGHGLSVGDRLLSAVAGAGSLTTTTNYVVHTVIDANQFKVALASSPETIVTTTAAPTSLSFYQQSAFGAGNVPVQLGDSATGANNVSVLTGGAVEIERAIHVTSNGTGVATLGGNTDNNSTFSGAVTLAKDINISQVATTGDNAVTFSGEISGIGFGVSKVGAGKAVLSAANSYTGDTKVLAGTLSLSHNDLANSADVYLTSGAFLDLAFDGTDTIDSLFVDGVMQAMGTWGGDGSGATHISPWISGLGRLLITNGPASLPGDFNSDGKVNAADYVLWRRNSGSPAGYMAWRQNFGNPLGSGSSLDESAAVPEPSALGLLALAAGIGLLGQRRFGAR